ncbi:MAG: type II toxin-antitoxin system VapC family toxin [Syntrophaceae bacterium]|nr:type II toxin-antitoxin system VapC family toxin [Pseudomonadota bacterium]MCG2741199.1 type II toxin-antitoxin system VapC family toxin [Syntrophaceae bacterium]
MIAVDTNILVRYAVKDDKRQTALATSFIADNECRVLKSVILELVWVLSSSSGYNLTRKVVTERLRHIMGLPTIDTEDVVQVAQAINWYEKGMDFADALHLASSCKMKGFATLDGKMSRKALQIAPTQNILLVE